MRTEVCSSSSRYWCKEEWLHSCSKWMGTCQWEAMVDIYQCIRWTLPHSLCKVTRTFCSSKCLINRSLKTTRQGQVVLSHLQSPMSIALCCLASKRAQNRWATSETGFRTSNLMASLSMVMDRNLRAPLQTPTVVINSLQWTTTLATMMRMQITCKTISFSLVSEGWILIATSTSRLTRLCLSKRKTSALRSSKAAARFMRSSSKPSKTPPLVDQTSTLTLWSRSCSLISISLTVSITFPSSSYLRSGKPTCKETSREQAREVHRREASRQDLLSDSGHLDKWYDFAHSLTLLLQLDKFEALNKRI